jgi:hypothetical protein
MLFILKAKLTQIPNLLQVKEGDICRYGSKGAFQIYLIFSLSISSHLHPFSPTYSSRNACKILTHRNGNSFQVNKIEHVRNTKQDE